MRPICVICARPFDPYLIYTGAVEMENDICASCYSTLDRIKDTETNVAITELIISLATRIRGLERKVGGTGP